MPQSLPRLCRLVSKLLPNMRRLFRGRPRGLTIRLSRLLPKLTKLLRKLQMVIRMPRSLPLLSVIMPRLPRR